MSKKCKIPSCCCEAVSNGMCKKHDLHNRRYGTPYPNHTPRGVAKAHQKEYNSYRSMKNRCLCPTDKNYPRWGGRGVSICSRWLDGAKGFLNFLEDLGPRPEGYTLDRVDVDGDYCPENCRWADKYTQVHNTKRYKEGDVPGVRWVKEKGDYEANYKNGDLRKTKHFKSRDAAIAQRKAWENEACKQDSKEK